MFKLTFISLACRYRETQLDVEFSCGWGWNWVLKIDAGLKWTELNWGLQLIELKIEVTFDRNLWRLLKSLLIGTSLTSQRKYQIQWCKENICCKHNYLATFTFVVFTGTFLETDFLHWGPSCIQQYNYVCVTEILNLGEYFFARYL